MPVGVYIARQESLQKITPVGLVAGIANKGTWPGSLYSWGASRVWLEPSMQNDTKGRSGFTVHGGWVPGSAGCIDLTSQISDFSKWFEKNGKDMIIFVNY